MPIGKANLEYTEQNSTIVLVKNRTIPRNMFEYIVYHNSINKIMHGFPAGDVVAFDLCHHTVLTDTFIFTYVQNYSYLSTCK